MSDNLAIWKALEKTDPAATKGFSRAGGFKGTATKPIWNIKRMTEQFGPCGIGWGMTEPKFETHNGDGELLVFCTVGIWHSGDKTNLVYGVGGDKVVTKRQSGTFNNDEAFKSAYTDAQSNAFKQIGVGADVHMGLFDDSKYRDEVDREFRAAEQGDRSPADDFFERAKLAISNHTDAAALQAWVDANLGHLNSLPAEQGKLLRSQFQKRMGALSQAPGKAAA